MDTPHTPTPSTTVLDLLARFEAASAEYNHLREERTKRINAYHASGKQTTPEQTTAFRDLERAYYYAQTRAEALAAALKALGDK